MSHTPAHTYHAHTPVHTYHTRLCTHIHTCAHISPTPVHTSFIVYDKSDTMESPASRLTLHMIVKMMLFLVILTIVLLYMENRA